jgi:hypothetical protein
VLAIIQKKHPQCHPRSVLLLQIHPSRMKHGSMFTVWSRSQACSTYASRPFLAMTDSASLCGESSPHASRVSPMASESLILPSEPGTPPLKQLRPLPAIPNESHELCSRPIRSLPTPPLSFDSRRNAHSAVLRVETCQSMGRDNSCDSPTIIATALPPPSHAVARVESTLGPEEDAAHNPIDWDLLERLLCGKYAER